MSGLPLSLMGAISPSQSASSLGSKNPARNHLMGVRGNFRSNLRSALGIRSVGAKGPVMAGMSRMPAATKDVSDAQALLLALSIREIVADLAGQQAAAVQNPQQQIQQNQQILQALSDFDAVLQGGNMGRIGRAGVDNALMQQGIVNTKSTGSNIEKALEDFLNGNGNANGLLGGALNLLMSSPELVDTLAENDCKLCQYLQPRMGENNSTLAPIVQQLQNVLNRMNQTNGGQATSLANSVLEQVGQMFKQATVENPPQSIPGEQAIPDLIYIGETNGSGARLLSVAENWSDTPVDRGRFQLLTTPADASSRPVQALQVLLDRLMHIQANGPQDMPEEGLSDNDQMLIDFLNGRLDPEGMGGMRQIAGAMVQAEVREAAMAESVRQVQAMMADMAERMQGQVLMDTKNLRAVMHLEPPILGRVHVALQLGEDGSIVAHMSADQSATQDFLQQNESELRQGLANDEHNPEDIEIVFDENISRAFAWELNGMTTA